MTRTTDQWEALLVPKMPEKLWVEESDWDDEAWDVCFRHPKWDVPASLGLAHRKDVAHLFAASPEAVAEVVRLHRAFEEWATRLEELSTEMEAQGHHLNAQQINSVVGGIHLILKGGNDE